VNISGIVVKAAPEHLQNVLESLKSSGLCDVHFHDGSGKIIVTVEGRDTGEEVRKMKAIMDLPHVLSAGLAYSCNENEMTEAFEHFKTTGTAVPDSLKE
jgi:nitrate reductase NapD